MPPRVTEEKKIVIEGSDPKQEKLVGADKLLRVVQAAKNGTCGP